MLVGEPFAVVRGQWSSGPGVLESSLFCQICMTCNVMERQWAAQTATVGTYRCQCNEHALYERSEGFLQLRRQLVLTMLELCICGVS